MSDGHKRWIATIFYRAEAFVVDVPHAIEELEELQSIVEGGPDWNTIEKIEIRLAVVTRPNLTLETQ